MEIHVSTDNHIANDARLVEIVRDAATNALGRFVDRVTRVDAHFADENGGKGGATDTRCSLEARVAGHQPSGVTHHASNVKDALSGALTKLEKVLAGIADREKEKRG
jgi:hypothetical protein